LAKRLDDEFKFIMTKQTSEDQLALAAAVVMQSIK
jgi:hypothetical protein